MLSNLEQTIREIDLDWKIIEEGMSAEEAAAKLAQIVKKPATPERIRELFIKLQRAKIALQDDHPFFGTINTYQTVIITTDVDTMAVDNDYNIYINPNFTLDILDEQEVVGVLAHEAYHIANRTFERKGSRDHELWNIATDCIMNRDLCKVKAHLPALAYVPYQTNGGWAVKYRDKEFIITNLTCEALYDIFEEYDKQNPPQPPPQPPQEPKAGDIIRDKKTGQYGKVTAVNPNSGELEFDPMTKEEVEEFFKTNES